MVFGRKSCEFKNIQSEPSWAPTLGLAHSPGPGGEAGVGTAATTACWTSRVPEAGLLLASLSPAHTSTSRTPYRAGAGVNLSCHYSRGGIF